MRVASAQPSVWLRALGPCNYHHFSYRGLPRDYPRLCTTLPGVDSRRLRLAAAGTRFLRFRVTGRHPANTTGPSWIVLDRVVLTPVADRAGNTGKP